MYSVYFFGMVKGCKEGIISKNFTSEEEAKIFLKCIRRHSIYTIEDGIFLVKEEEEKTF